MIVLGDGAFLESNAVKFELLINSAGPVLTVKLEDVEM